mgnify:FL=1
MGQKFVQTDITFLRPFNDSGYWIFSYDDEIITPEQMLEQVRTDEEVISAEFNKKIYENMEEEQTEKEAGSKASEDAKPPKKEARPGEKKKPGKQKQQ